jgi:hypothetical protein
VAGWLQIGIIERSRSPYNSPIFCVPKKEGQGLRCVLDYRRVNHSSFSDRYALRTIDECLETVGRAGSKVYSALDCSSAFWQLQLRPSDRLFTAFTIPGKGQYHWRTCPQGLMGAPASFSRLMEVLLADAENMLTYIDDVQWCCGVLFFNMSFKGRPKFEMSFLPSARQRSCRRRLRKTYLTPSPALPSPALPSPPDFTEFLEKS